MDEIQASSVESMGWSNGESEVSLVFSFGVTGEVQPKQVPTAKADKLAKRIKIKRVFQNIIKIIVVFLII